MSKYQEFQKRFQASGLPQKAFAEREGMSASSVWYYLNKARKEQEQQHSSGTFQEVEIAESQTDVIQIRTSSGVQIDNNLIENKIRPLALGRKNYLFAGSHAGAERIAMMYSFIGTCKARDVNPYEWMKETTGKVADNENDGLT